MRTIDYTELEDEKCVLVKISEQTHRLLLKLHREIGVSGDSIISVCLQEKLDEIEKEKRER